MPIYEYRCGKCGNVFEQFRAGSGDGDGGPACPGCGSKKSERVFSVFSSQCGAPAGGSGAPSGGCGSGGFS